MEPQILEAMNWRYATQKFDMTKPLTDEQVSSLLNITRLAPSSFGIEPWHFIVVTNPEIRLKLKDAAYGQTKVAESSHLVVIAQKTDGVEALNEHLQALSAANNGAPLETFDRYKTMVSGTLTARSTEDLSLWFAKQTYIALGVLVEAAALMGIDAGPMEGFDPAAFDEILGLTTKNLHAVSIVALGHRAEDDAAITFPKARMALNDAVSFVK